MKNNTWKKIIKFREKIMSYHVRIMCAFTYPKSMTLIKNLN